MDRLICLECEHHLLDKKKQCILCTWLYKQRTVDKYYRCPIRKSRPYQSKLVLAFPTQKTPEENHWESLIKKAMISGNWREVQDYRDAMIEKQNRIKEQEEKVNSQAISRLNRLNINEITCENYNSVKKYLVDSISKNNLCDDYILEIICDWNYSELGRRKKLQETKTKILESKIKVENILDIGFLKNILAVQKSYSKSIVWSDRYGEEDHIVYNGFGFISIELEEIDALKYVVLVYDKHENNGGHGDNCIKPLQLYDTLIKYSPNYPLVLREKRNNEIEIIKDFYYSLSSLSLLSSTDLVLELDNN